MVGLIENNLGDEKQDERGCVGLFETGIISNIAEFIIKTRIL